MKIYNQWKKYWFDQCLLARDKALKNNDNFNLLTIDMMLNMCNNKWINTNKWSQADREFLEIYNNDKRD